MLLPLQISLLHNIFTLLLILLEVYPLLLSLDSAKNDRITHNIICDYIAFTVYL